MRIRLHKVLHYLLLLSAGRRGAGQHLFELGDKKSALVFRKSIWCHIMPAETSSLLSFLANLAFAFYGEIVRIEDKLAGSSPYPLQAHRCQPFSS